MGELSKCKNIGVAVEKQLNEVGITTLEQLRDIGSKEAWLKIQEIDSSACYNRLCGLEGALQDIRWHDLPQNTKNHLKEFYNAHKMNWNESR